MSAMRRMGPLVLAVGAVACAPTLDWRAFQPEAAHVVVTLPCRPAGHERALTLAGGAVAFRLFACEAAGLTFALAHADLGDPQRVAQALQSLLEAARDNVHGDVTADEPARVQGTVPRNEARRQRMKGRLPDGRAIEVQAQVFAYGTHVYQATLLGAQVPDDVANAFFGSLRIQP